MMSRAKATKSSEDLNAANDYASLIARFEKKIYDLELTRTIAMQTAPQIRLIQITMFRCLRRFSPCW